MKHFNIKNLIKKKYLNGLAVPGDDKMDQRILTDARAAMEKSQKTRSVAMQPNIWRIIMQSKITKLTAAAAVFIIALSLFNLFSATKSPDGTESISCFTLLSRACAAEQAFFAGEDIVHIVNEIIVYPAAEDSELAQAWLPMTSLQANGKFRFDQLKLPTKVDQPYTVSDQAWYDPVNGRFARVMKTDENVIFANSYDGKFIYTFEKASDGSLQVISEPVTENFTPPQKPAEFLGLTAGLRSSLQKETHGVQEIDEGVLEDGSSVRIFKVGTPDPDGRLKAYWLFKIRIDDGTNAENEFVIDGRTQFIIRRILTESVDKPEISWNLAEIDQQEQSSQESPKVSITANMVIPNVSVQHMIERASFETYIFTANPSWAGERVITDCIDPPSPPNRMFIITYRADDGRHVVLVQSKTYNMMLATKVAECQSIYTSPGGFKLWATPADKEKWLAGILLSSARSEIKDPPADDRTCFVLESSAGAFSALAINGQLTDEELHQLVDSLVPAKNYQE